MVARVDRWHRLDNGRLVVLEHRAGRIEALIEANDPAEAWMCRLIGPHARPRDHDARELYLPDICLTPVGAMNSDQMAELKRAQALEAFDDALADLGKLLSRGDATQADFHENLDLRLDLGAQQALIGHALQQVATGTALHEVGFRHVTVDQDLMRWVLGRPADRLSFEAIQGPFGTWRLSCIEGTAREAIIDEAMMMPEGKRGELLLPLLRIWRSARPGQSTPQGLMPAKVLLDHKATVKLAMTADLLARGTT